MKKGFVLVLLTVVFIGCNQTQKKPVVEEQDGEEIIESKRAELEFKIDEKIEVLYYVFLLTDYPLVSRYSTTYKEAAIEYFQPYKEHEVIPIIEGLFEQGFGADFPVNWIFQYGELPELEKKGEVDFPFELISSDSLELFRKALSSFYIDAKCDSFFVSQKGFLDKMILSAEDSIERKDIIEVIEDYYGIYKEAKYTMVLSPLLHQGGFALERTDVAEQYAFVGPNKVKDSVPQFDQVFLEQDMIIHEFGHNYVNPVVDQFLDQTIELEKVLYPIVKERVREEGYAYWDSYLYELVDRSITIRIAEAIYGKAAGEELLAYEKSVGFEHCEFLIEVLKKYEDNRTEFKTFSDFFPSLIESLETEINRTK